MLTLEQVAYRIDDIKQVADDDEVAHAKEDRLHDDVLRAIADGTAESPREMAALVLTTNDIDFARRCA